MRAMIGVASLLMTCAAIAADTDADPVLAGALSNAPVSLEQGMAASEREGKPISAKYELEVDGLQLSVYTMRDGKFSEVIVDHGTGQISKIIPITEGNDLVDAREQRGVMEHAKRSLQDAAADAVRAHAGFRAVSAMPGRKDGRPIAEVMLTNGKEWVTVNQMLDRGE